MFTLPSAVRIFFATQPIDMRKSYDGLSIAVAEILKQDPLSGHLYVFRNRRANQIRMIFWDRTGYCIFGKRLAQGTFRVVFELPEGVSTVEVEAAELGLLLEGIELLGAKRSKRWRVAGKDISMVSGPAHR
jgi:transposase